MSAILERSRCEPCYRMQPHAFLCEVSEGGVILDLQHDRYISLSQSQMQVLSTMVQGWPQRRDPAPANCDTADVARDLLQQGLLTDDLSLGKDAHPVRLPKVARRLVEPDIVEHPAFRRSHLLVLGKCCVSTWLVLRVLPLKRVIQRIAQPAPEDTKSPPRFDLDRGAALLRIFLWLRPLFYTAKDRCLYDSLVLREFMAHYGLYPKLVIGVKAFAPFSAHSWVQFQDHALNGAPDRLNMFVPILAV